MRNRSQAKQIIKYQKLEYNTRETEDNPRKYLEWGNTKNFKEAKEVMDKSQWGKFVYDL